MHPYLTFAGIAIAISFASFGLLLVARSLFNLFIWFVYLLKEWVGRYEYGKYHPQFNPNPKKRINSKFVQMTKPLGIEALNDGKMVESSIIKDIKHPDLEIK